MNDRCDDTRSEIESVCQEIEWASAIVEPYIPEVVQRMHDRQAAVEAARTRRDDALQKHDNSMWRILFCSRKTILQNHMEVVSHYESCYVTSIEVLLDVATEFTKSSQEIREAERTENMKTVRY